MTSSRRNDLLYFATMVLLAFIVSTIPVVHWPFSWMETFFHEISHGLTSIATGGRIRTIELDWNGAGLCTTQGGIRFFVAFAGYAGAAVWGGLIYAMVDHASPKSANRIAMLIGGLIVLTALFWARDLVTWAILAIILVPFVIVVVAKDLPAERYFMQFCGLYILVNAIKAPLHLLDGRDKGDGATLQTLTWLPEPVWVLVWMAIGLVTMFVLFRRHVRLEAEASG
jgi:hypothetical protein